MQCLTFGLEMVSQLAPDIEKIQVVMLQLCLCEGIPTGC